ncbi:GTP-binding protein, partial [Tabrizicola sp.]|uniref:GTP-binding protein n=1 Tax=Tabrizicola sp. TaxID=2005166 RepID=UPI003F2BB63A
GAVPLTELFGAGPPEMGSDLPGAVDWVNGTAYALSSLPLPAFAPTAKIAEPTHGLFGPTPSPTFSSLASLDPAARHDDRISSVSATFDDPIHPMMLDIWLETLLASLGPSVLRMKAVIWAKGFETPFVMHGVQHIIDPPVRLQAWTGADRRSRIVLIGRDLPRESLREALDVLRTRPVNHRI